MKHLKIIFLLLIVINCNIVQSQSMDECTFKAINYIINNNFKFALFTLDECIANNPNNSSAYTERAHVKVELGDYYGAIKDCNISLTMNPDDADSYYRRGQAKYKLKKYQAAIIDFKKAVEISPSYAACCCEIARSYEKLLDNRKAILNYNLAISIDNKEPWSYYYRGNYYHKLKNYEAACQDWSIAGEKGIMIAYDKINKFCH